MTKANVRGLLISLLIGAGMAAGVIGTSAVAKADSEQDYYYLQLLEDNGFHVTNPAIAKNNAAIICDQLASGRNWKLVMTDLMTGTDSDLDTAAVQFAAAVLVYCPQLDPFNDQGVA